MNRVTGLVRPKPAGATAGPSSAVPKGPPGHGWAQDHAGAAGSATASGAAGNGTQPAGTGLAGPPAGGTGLAGPLAGGNQAGGSQAGGSQADASAESTPEQTVPLSPYTPMAALAALAQAQPPQDLAASRNGLAMAARPGRLPVPRTAADVAEPDAPLFWDRDRARRAAGCLLSPFGSPFGGLAGDPWVAVWLRRAAASAVVGAALAVGVAWPAGLAAALGVAALDALYRSRTSTAVPPALRAASAQRRTRRRLARLAPAGYLSLHARTIPGTDSVIDHLVVGPAGIYAVDSEVWDRRLPVRATRGGKLFHGPVDQAARLAHACWEAAEVSRLLSVAIGQPVAVRPAMVIYGPTVPWTVVRLGGVDVFRGGRLRRYLRREASVNRARCLDERHAEAVHAIAAQVLPPAR